MFGEQVAGAGLGLILGEIQDQKQLEQQKRMQELQIQGQMRMGKFNQQLALEMWEATNYAAQVAQMEKAGLNVGLMYGKGGPGGTTNTPTGTVAGGQASQNVGMGMQLGLQMAMQQAQIENIKANTEKTKVDTAKTGGVDTEAVKTGIEQMKAQTDNIKITNQINEYERQLKEIETTIARQTQETVINQIGAQYKLLKEQIVTQAQQNEQVKQIMPELIKQAKQTTLEQAIRMDLIRAQVIKTGQETEATKASIQKVAAEIIRMQEQTAQGERALDQNYQKNAMDMMEAEFKYGNTYNFKTFIEHLDKIIPF